MSEQSRSLESASASADTDTTPAATYQARCDAFATRRDYYRRWSNRTANLSVALVLAALICLALGIWRGEVGWYIGAALFFLGFIASFLNQGRLDGHAQRYQTLWTINDEGLRRLRRDWAKLPLRQPSTTDLHHPYAADLDLLGHASLQHLLGTPNTPVGQATLQDWLLHPAAPAEALARQPAVAELAPQIALRDELAVTGRLMDTSQASYERFLDWAEGQPWLLGRPWLLWLARLLPLVTLALLAAQLLGLLAYPFWLLFFFINMALSLTLGRTLHEMISEVGERARVYESYATLFHIFTGQTFAAPALQALQADLSAGGLRADQQMRRLARLMPLAQIRQMMFFFVIQWLTLWDFHVLWLLERWQRDVGPFARGWLVALGKVEALAALATLSYDHADWTFPAITPEQEAAFVARKLGHPLLAPTVCVGNDVSVGKPGTLLLVTGSNMSGKSTLLRAIGVNTVLAQMGAPVCAVSLEMRPITLATTIRVQDSLEQGISYFMAELKRLKVVVDRAEQTRAAGGSVLLFLLDEILHGTNTSERQIAVRQILHHLLRLGAAGAVSTHDLTLADAPEVAAVSQRVHFTETFTRGPEGLTMQFDYILRPGIATSTNALKLLEMVGLPVDC